MAALLRHAARRFASTAAATAQPPHGPQILLGQSRSMAAPLSIPSDLPAWWTTTGPRPATLDLSLSKVAGRLVGAWRDSWLRLLSMEPTPALREIEKAYRTAGKTLPRDFFRRALMLCASTTQQRALFWTWWQRYCDTYPGHQDVLDYTFQMQLHQVLTDREGMLATMKEMREKGIPRTDYMYLWATVFQGEENRYDIADRAITHLLNDETVTPSARLVSRLCVLINYRQDRDAWATLLEKYVPVLRERAPFVGQYERLRVPLVDLWLAVWRTRSPKSTSDDYNAALAKFRELVNEIDMERGKLKDDDILPAANVSRSQARKAIDAIHNDAVVTFISGVDNQWTYQAIIDARTSPPTVWSHRAVELMLQGIAAEMMRQRVVVLPADGSPPEHSPYFLWQPLADHLLSSSQPISARIYSHLAQCIQEFFLGDRQKKDTDQNVREADRTRSHTFGYRSSYDAINALYTRAISEGVVLTPAMFTTLLSSLKRWNPPTRAPPTIHADEALRILKDMQRQRVTLTDIMRVHAISCGIRRRNDYAEAREAAKAARANKPFDIQPEIAAIMSPYRHRAEDDEDSNEEIAADKFELDNRLVPLLDELLDRMHQGTMVLESTRDVTALLRLLGHIVRIDEQISVWKHVCRTVEDTNEMMSAEHAFLESAAFAIKVRTRRGVYKKRTTVDTIDPTSTTAKLARHILMSYAMAIHERVNEGRAVGLGAYLTTYSAILSLCADTGDDTLADPVLWARENNLPPYIPLIRLLASSENITTTDIAMDDVTKLVPSRGTTLRLHQIALYQYLRACPLERIERLLDVVPMEIAGPLTLRMAKERLREAGNTELVQTITVAVDNMSSQIGRLCEPFMRRIDRAVAQGDFVGAVIAFEQMSQLTPPMQASFDQVLKLRGHRLVTALQHAMFTSLRPQAIKGVEQMLTMKYPDQFGRPWLGRLVKLVDLYRGERVARLH